MRRKRKSLHNRESLVVHLVMIFLSLCCLIPFLYLVGISLSNELDIAHFGYRLIPKKVDLTGYRYVMADPKVILKAYGFTIFTSFVGTALSVCLTALMAYPLSVRNYKLRRFWSIYLFITMVFNGGLAASYIVRVIYLGMKNTIWVFILPGAVGAFNVILVRTFFQGLPEEMMDAAKIDGADHLQIFTRITLPLSKPVLATIALFGILARWNDWMTTNIYAPGNKDLVTLQYLLQSILKNIEEIQLMMDKGFLVNVTTIPSESTRMAMAVLAAGPMIVVFPFFQKYFARGLTVGSLKG